MAEILEAVTFGASRGQRQHGVQAVEGLDGCLLVRREDDGVLGRIQVEADHVGGLSSNCGSSESMYRSNRCG